MLLEEFLKIDIKLLKGIDLAAHNLVACLNGHEGDIEFTSEQINKLVLTLDNRIEAFIDE